MSFLHESLGGKHRELWSGQRHLDPWESGGASNPGKHFQTYDG